MMSIGLEGISDVWGRCSDVYRRDTYGVIDSVDDV